MRFFALIALLATAFVASPAWSGCLTPNDGCDSGGGAGAGASNSLVRINEVLKTPLRGAVVDDTGFRAGFIELKNTGPSVDLAGYELVPIGSPHPSYTLPSYTLGVGAYLRIWTTAYDDSSDLSNIHASFQLIGADVVELRDPDGATVETFDIRKLPEDYSLGKCQENCAGRAYEYFSTPSPGAANTTAGGAVRAEVASPYGYSVPVRRTTQVPGYYTPTDGGVARDIGVTATSALDWGWVQLDVNTGKVYTDFDSDVWSRNDGDTGAGQPAITVEDTLTWTKAGDSNTSVELTVVPWEAHHSSIEWDMHIFSPIKWGNLVGVLNGSRNEDGWAYFSISGDDTIWRTQDGFITREEAGVRPTGQTDWHSSDTLLRTSFGDFYFATEVAAPNRSLTIYRSLDGMQTWTAQTVDGGPGTTIRETPLQEGYDWYFDGRTNTGYVVTTEYDACFDANDNGVADEDCAATTADFTRNLDHTVYIAEYSGSLLTSGTGDFVTAYTFPSQADFLSDANANPRPATHIHVAYFDDWSGDLWIATGSDSYIQDRPPGVNIMVSNDPSDYGSNFYHFAQGEQAYRMVSMWATERGIYHTNDTGTDQRLFFIPRSYRGATTADEWDPISPLQTSGDLVGGWTYLIVDDSGGALGSVDSACAPSCTIGDYIEEENYPETTLIAGDEVIPLGSLQRNVVGPDYRTEVARLDMGAHYYSAWADIGHSVRIFGVARDVNQTGRGSRGDVMFLWGVAENPDGTWDVQEVHSEEVPPADTPGINNATFRRPVIRAIDANNNLYFDTTITWTRNRVGRLEWNGIPAAQTNGVDFTRDQYCIGGYLFDETGDDLGDDSCLWSPGAQEMPAGSTGTLIAHDFINADIEGGGQAGRVAGPTEFGRHAADMTQVGGADRPLYFDDSGPMNFQDDAFYDYTMGCFAASQAASGDLFVFGERGARTASGSHGLIWDDDGASSWAGMSFRGGTAPNNVEISSGSSVNLNGLTDWHFLASRIQRARNPWGAAVALAAGGNPGYTGQRDVYLDGVKTDGTEKASVSSASSDPLLIGAFTNIAIPPTSAAIGINGYVADCFWTRRALSDAELCQICSCGLTGEGVTGTGRNASACNSCTMAYPTCDADPF